MNGNQVVGIILGPNSFAYQATVNIGRAITPLTAVGEGPGGSPTVKVYSGLGGALTQTITAYAPAFASGVRVAVGDLTGDGIPDIVTGAGPGGGPHVKVFSGADNAQLDSFFAFDPTFTGGVQVSSVDFNGDGQADLVTGAGPGGGPHVKDFNGSGLSELQSFFAFDPTFSGGTFVG
jgi:hypothetical protein